MGRRAEHLYHRDGVYYFRAIIRKKLVCRAIGAVSRDRARKMAREWYPLAVMGRLEEILGITRNRDDYARVSELFAAYKAVVRRLGRPTELTAHHNTLSMSILLRRVHGMEADAGAMSTALLTHELVAEYLDAVLPEGISPQQEERARRSAVSTIRQARSILARRLLNEPEYRRLKLPDLRPFIDAHPGANPARELPMPGWALRRATLEAAAKLWRDRSPLYPVYLLASHCGLRAGEMAAARWTWIEYRNQKPVLALRDRPEEGFWVKGQSGSVPVPPAAWRRLQAFKGSEFILGQDTVTDRRNLVAREFAAWMSRLGWDRIDSGKRAHELRRLYGSKLWTKYGKERCHENMRHRSFATTERHYLHLNADWRPRELWGV